MKKVSLKKLSIFLAAVIAMIMIFSVVSFAAPEDEATAVTTEEEAVVDNTTSTKAIAAGFGMAAASIAGAVSMAIAIKSSVTSVARQPEAAGSIQTNMMLGLVFIETAIIYALIIAILIVFVL